MKDTIIQTGDEPEPEDDGRSDEPNFMSVEQLIREGRFSHGEIATAVERVGIDGEDRYGRWRRFRLYPQATPDPLDVVDPAALGELLDLIAEDYALTRTFLEPWYAWDDPSAADRFRGVRFGWWSDELATVRTEIEEATKLTRYEPRIAGGTQKGRNYSDTLIAALAQLADGTGSSGIAHPLFEQNPDIRKVILGNVVGVGSARLTADNIRRALSAATEAINTPVGSVQKKIK